MPPSREFVNVILRYPSAISNPSQLVPNQEPTVANEQANRDKHQLSYRTEDFDGELFLHLVAEGINIGDHDDGKENHPPAQLRKGQVPQDGCGFPFRSDKQFGNRESTAIHSKQQTVPSVFAVFVKRQPVFERELVHVCNLQRMEDENDKTVKSQNVSQNETGKGTSSTRAATGTQRGRGYSRCGVPWKRTGHHSSRCTLSIENAGKHT